MSGGIIGGMTRHREDSGPASNVGDYRIDHIGRAHDRSQRMLDRIDPRELAAAERLYRYECSRRRDGQFAAGRFHLLTPMDRRGYVEALRRIVNGNDRRHLPFDAGA